MYANEDHSEPMAGEREVRVVIWDEDGAASLPVSIFIYVMRKNDRPNLDLGVGENQNDSTSFMEIASGTHDVGIHVTSHPHRIMISDEEEEGHYTTKVVMTLR